MNTRCLLGIFLCLTLFSASAQADSLNNWSWRNPVVLTNGSPLATGPHQLYGLVFTNGQFLGVGDAGTAALSSDGTNWTEYASATTNQLNAIGYFDGAYVAVGNGGTVESSADGIHWILGFSGTTNDLACITFGASKFLAAGGNVVTASTDGTNWTTAGISGISGASSITYGSAGFMAVNNSRYVYTSADGLTWSSQWHTNIYYVRPGPITNYLNLDAVSFINGSYYCGGELYTSSGYCVVYLLASANGSSWTPHDTGTFSFNAVVGNLVFAIRPRGNDVMFFEVAANFINTLYFNGSSIGSSGNPVSYYHNGYDAAFGNGVWVLTQQPFGGASVLTSVDTTNWVQQQRVLKPYTGPTNNFTGFASTNGIYLAVGAGGVACSTNGLVYYTVSNSPPLNSIIYSKTNFFGVGPGGTVYVSTNGVAWAQKNSGTASNLRSITEGNGLLVAVGDNGAIQTSTTGNVWSSRLSGSSITLSGVAFANSQFVVVGQLGTVLTSPDGINWTGQDCGLLTNLLSVAYGPAGFLVVGSGGTAASSFDGVNWMQQFLGSTNNLESVTAGNGFYLVAGDGGWTKTSPDGVNWVARNLGATTGQNFLGAAFSNSRFTVVGTGGAIVESDAFGPLFALQLQRVVSGNKLTVFAPIGTNFRIQASSNLTLSAWSDIATFNNANAVSLWTNSVAGSQQFFRCISP